MCVLETAPSCKCSSLANDIPPVVVFQSLEWGNPADGRKVLEHIVEMLAAAGQQQRRPRTTRLDNDDDAAQQQDGNNLPRCSQPAGAILLVLGSDLIYDCTVVRPLLETVQQLLLQGGPRQQQRGSNNDKHDNLSSSSASPNSKNHSSRFVLSQSFAFDERTEQEINDCCHDLGLTRSVLLEQPQRQQHNGHDEESLPGEGEKTAIDSSFGPSAAAQSPLSFARIQEFRLMM